MRKGRNIEASHGRATAKALFDLAILLLTTGIISAGSTLVIVEFAGSRVASVVCRSIQFQWSRFETLEDLGDGPVLRRVRCPSHSGSPRWANPCPPRFIHGVLVCRSSD